MDSHSMTHRVTDVCEEEGERKREEGNGSKKLSKKEKGSNE